MKKTKRCPKCGCEDVFLVEGYCGGHGIGNNIMTGLTILSAAPVDRYVCGRCGYSEEWVRREDIGKVRSSSHAREL